MEFMKIWVEDKVKKVKKAKNASVSVAGLLMLVFLACTQAQAGQAHEVSPDLAATEGDETSTESALAFEDAENAAAAEINLDDGDYSIEVAMTGGSGRASISSPAKLTVRDGRAYVTLIWSSSHYDYMIVDGEKYFNSNEGGSSTFEVPIIAFDSPVMVTADTDAMGEPLEIDYAITCYAGSIGSTDDIPQVAARKVLITGMTVIILGGILNVFVKRRRRRRQNAAAGYGHRCK